MKSKHAHHIQIGIYKIIKFSHITPLEMIRSFLTILTLHIITFLPKHSLCQIKEFSQLQTIMNADIPSIKKLIKQEGYTYSQIAEFQKNLKCELWEYKGNSKINNAICLCSMVNDKPIYFFMDTTSKFLQNAKIELKKQGYTQSQSSEIQLFEKDSKFVLIFKLNGTRVYTFAKSMTSLMSLGMMGMEEDEK